MKGGGMMILRGRYYEYYFIPCSCCTYCVRCVPRVQYGVRTMIFWCCGLLDNFSRKKIPSTPVRFELTQA